MTKILYSFLILFFLLIFSCKQQNKNIGRKEEGNNSTAAANKPVIKLYTTFVNGLDTSNMNSVSSAAKEFSFLFAKADTNTADSGFVIFNALYEKVENSLNEQLIKDPTDYSIYAKKMVEKKQLKSSKADEFVKNLKENGFSIDLIEGTTYIKQDRDFFTQHFYNSVSSAMKTYLQQQNKENKEGFINYAGLVITPLEVSNRIIFWENFIKNNPNFNFLNEIKNKQKEYITFLFEGIDNTPLFKHRSLTINTNFREAYENILTNYPGSSIAALLHPYYEMLKQKDAEKIKQLLQQYKEHDILYDYSS